MARLWLALAVCSVSHFLIGQNPPQPQFLDHAIVSEADSEVTVHANDPRPLLQALEAIRNQYWWTIDYEDPQYESYDLVDSTDPKWRVAHPHAKGVNRVAGTTFITKFYAGVDSVPTDEQAVLEKVVSDYNSSGNPGRFTIVKGDNARFSVVGISVRDASGEQKPVTPILDNRISFPEQERTLDQTFRLITSLLTVTTGQRVYTGGVANNFFIQTRVKAGSTDLTARDILAQICDRYALSWRLMYDPNPGLWFLHLGGVEPAKRNSNGPTSRLRSAPLKAKKSSSCSYLDLSALRFRVPGR